MATGGRHLTEWTLSDTSSPREFGLWVQSILLANPDREFLIRRSAEREAFIIESIPLVDEQGQHIPDVEDL